MLKQLPCVHMESAPFRTQPIRRDAEGKAARFELERRACQSLRKVLQLKLEQRRTREELVNQGIIPPLKSSTSFHEQKRSLERARTEDYLKRKIKRRPHRTELIRMNILEGVIPEEAELEKRARLADDLNNKISQRPGPMELIHKNILPVHTSIKSAFTDELSSAEEDSLDSPQSPLSSGTLTLTPSAAQMITLPTCVQKITAENKINSENCIQKHKKPNDDRPKMKKLKYHEYVPPDQKGDKEAPPKLDSSYAKLLQQQQLFLHLQILSQQQQSQTHQQNKTDQEQLRPSSVDAPSASAHKAPAEESFKQEGLPQNLDELKVAELKAVLKLRGLPVSGTKSDLMEKLRVHQAGGSGRDSTRAQSPGGAIELGAEGATKVSRAAANGHLSPAIKPHTSTFQRKKCDNNSSRCELNSLENTSIVTEPKEGTTEMLDHRPAPPPRLCSIKEEQRSPIPVSLYIQKCRLVCPATSNLPTSQKSPALLADKDSMLRQKDRQIEELKRLLLHNQHLVDMLKIKLEKRKRQEQKMELLRVVPPDKNNQCSKTPFSTSEIAVKVKQEILSDDYKETGPQLESKLTDGNTGQHGRHLQAVHRLLLQQQRRLNRQQQLVIPRENRSAEHKQKKVCQEKKMKTLQRQQSTELDSKQILQRQERRLKGCQRIQVLTQRDLELQSTQISPVCPEKKLSHMPALVTDGNGNHFLISLKNSVTESQTHGDTPKPITSQQFQSSPSDVPGHSSAQLPAADNEDRAIMHMGGLTQQSTKPSNHTLPLFNVRNVTTIPPDLDHRPAPPPRLCSIKEEQRSPIPVSLYIQKCRLVCPATSNLPTSQKSPALLADKDSMLRQKDRQIEELKRLLLHNQHLVDMLKIKLEKRKRQEQKMELLRVVPPDKNNQCSKTPFSTSEIAVKVKQEILSDDYKETGPQLESKLTDGNTGQHGRHLQAVHRLLLQQQRRLNRQQQLVIPRENRSAEHKQKKVCQEKKMKTLQRQQSTELDSKQILQRQERRLKGCQRIQVLTQRDLELQSTQISPVCPEKKLSHMPALVTDGNGNHFLISLKNSVTESQTHGDTPKPITSQQFQSSPSDVPGHSSAQLPAADNEDRAIMHMGGLTQQSTKAECAGLQQHFTERLCESDNSDTSGHSQEKCTGLDWIFSPLSSTTTSPDPKDPLHEDFIDIILKTGDISRFKPTPDPSLDDLHHSPPSPPMLLSPAVASCSKQAKPAPSAPHTSPGRLEDFLESTTGRPLLGVEPGGPLTLIDDLHSQMLCTPSILDHPSSPMDIERAVDTVDWFCMTMEDNYGKDLKLAPTSPPAVFSADFLDTYDLETAWDSCL